jgi:DNA-binding NarL/FixJ family response regulator
MLTPRQMQVAALVAQNKTNKTIARELGVSVQTVKDHIHDAAARLPYQGHSARIKLVVFTLTTPA